MAPARRVFVDGVIECPTAAARHLVERHEVERTRERGRVDDDGVVLAVLASGVRTCGVEIGEQIQCEPSSQP